VRSVGIAVPAFNEEENLEKVVESLVAELQHSMLHFRILIINDGSSDNTLAIANILSQRYLSVEVLPFKRNHNLGHCLRESIAFFEEEDYWTWLPSDGEVPPEVIVKMLKLKNENNIIISTPLSSVRMRGRLRVLLSEIFQAYGRFLTKTTVKYFNCPSVYNLSELKEMELFSKGFTINFEILSNSLDKSQEYIEVPFNLNERISGEAKALRLKNILQVLNFIVKRRWL